MQVPRTVSVACFAFVSVFAIGQVKLARYMTYAEAQPVLEDFAEELPTNIRGISTTKFPEIWPRYASEQDRETRQRLSQGDEDSLVNLLLYGTSFTSEPPLTSQFLQRSVPHEREATAGGLSEILARRADDLLAAMQGSQDNERLVFMRHLLASSGYSLDTSADRQRTRSHIFAALARVNAQFEKYATKLDQARNTADPDLEFAVRSTLFSDRGISLDTSIMPDYALEQALKQLLAEGVLTRDSVHHAAVIGPGLDFTDKSEGFDFYPQQTTQPFLLLDSLLRLGLARENHLDVTTLDISERVNTHIRNACARATNGQPYDIQLPLRTDRQWTDGARAFWKNAGSRVASSIKPVPVPATRAEVDIRAIRIPPPLVLRIHPRDENIVWQRLPLLEDEKFELIVATNILVYYDEFHQALALANIQSMLKPGGILLTNNGLPDVTPLAIHQIGSSGTAYSDQASDGDNIIWYRYLPHPPDVLGATVQHVH